MEKWQKTLQKAITSVDEIAGRFQIPVEPLRKVVKDFPFRVTPYYLSLIKEKNDPIYRQCIPDAQELTGNPDLMDDPLGEERLSPVPCIVHHYPDHCLFLVSNQCAAYCRFCTRKRKFRKPMCVDKEHIAAGIDYIRKNKAVREVLISGGDPFLLTDDKIEYILKELHAVPHIEVLRIGTRTPCVLPERITRKLVAMLKKYHPLFINVHFNHPDELTPQSMAALARLADAGIPLGSQTVLLKGVNDDPAVIRKLMQKLLTARVHPYYLFQTDLVFGTEHFRTPLSKGMEIMSSIRGWTSGMAVPHFAIDLPGGGGKIETLPDPLVRKEGRTYYYRNYCGEVHPFPDVEEDARDKSPDNGF